jgi:hypothetical protein
MSIAGLLRRSNTFPDEVMQQVETNVFGLATNVVVAGIDDGVDIGVDEITSIDVDVVEREDVDIIVVDAAIVHPRTILEYSLSTSFLI